MRDRRRRKFLALAARGAALAALLWMSVSAAEAAPAAVVWPRIIVTQVESGFAAPISVTHAGDGSGRLFIVERAGIIRIFQNGDTLGTAFLDLSPTGADRVYLEDSSERGLLSVAFPPGFPAEPKDHFYVIYTSNDPEGAGDSILPGDLVLERYGLTADDNVADPDDFDLILTISHQDAPNHNGGQLKFGDDGYLYISTGDGGGGGDEFENAQALDELLGKILRIDVEAGTDPYAIPATNPFVDDEDALDEIWAYGLRNPWRFTFDRVTNHMYIGDVGQGVWEEINFQPASSTGGENYGWNIWEGNHCYPPGTMNCAQPTAYSPPVAEYDHNEGCSVTGGYVYRGEPALLLKGVYLYADFCSGRIWGLKHDGVAWQADLLKDTDLMITTFGEDEAGNVYVADWATGGLYLIREDVHFLPLVFNE
jgi:glucose/arabinose dehydrogenase